MAAVKPIRILVLGHPYFVNKVRELAARFGPAGMPYRFAFGRGKIGKWISLWRCDLVYLIGGDLRPNWFYHLALFLKKIIIIHWVGSDILEMMAWRKQGNEFSYKLASQAVHWAEVNWTAKELQELGLACRVVPLTSVAFPEEVRDLPEKFVVLTYLPTGKGEFYGETTIVELARKMPDVVFLAVAAQTISRNPEWPSNLISVGWVDNMAEFYSEVVLIIRLTLHDGLSLMVLEALAHGRHVIWGYPFTGAYQTDGNIDRLVRFIEKLHQKHVQKDLQINRIGREFVARFYRPENVWDSISRGIQEVMNKSAKGEV